MTFCNLCKMLIVSLLLCVGSVLAIVLAVSKKLQKNPSLSSQTMRENKLRNLITYLPLVAISED